MVTSDEALLILEIDDLESNINCVRSTLDSLKRMLDRKRDLLKQLREEIEE